MELKQIRYFVAAAEQLYFSRAAPQRHVVQLAISQQIKRLEAELGTQLFERTGSEVRLTEAGRQMLPECRRLLSQWEETTRVARTAGAGLRGRIKFGSVGNSICALLPPLIRMFRSQFLDVEMSLQSLDRLEQAEARPAAGWGAAESMTSYSGHWVTMRLFTSYCLRGGKTSRIRR